MKKIILICCITAMVFSANIPDDYFQQTVNYTIQVKLDDQNHILRGNEQIEYINNSPETLNFIWMHLWPNAYKNNETAFAKQMWETGSTRFYFSKEKDRGYIDSLQFTVDGIPADLIPHPDWIDVAKLVLPEPLAPGETVSIETPFKVKIPKVFSRLGHSGKHYEITQWYPKPAVFDKEGWHAMPYLNMGEFYSEFGTFDVEITLPEDYVVMATGTLVDGDAEYAWLDSLAEFGAELKDLSKKELKKRMKELRKKEKREKKGKLKSIKKKLHLAKEEEDPTPVKMKTLHFRQENVHDFAWFADKKYIVQKGELELPYSGRKVTLWAMYLPKNAHLWQKSLEYLHDAGYWYSKFYGDYPYDHITAVDGDMSAGGGMEYPNITVISRTGTRDILEMVIMHEVGHNWFYGILGNNERDHAWMDEGLNEFSNFWYWEKKYGTDGAMKVMPDAMHNFILRNASFRWLAGYLGYQANSFTRDDQPIDIPSQDFHRRNYGSIIYAKTGIFTYFLKHYLGEKKMTEIMQDYYETWKFKHPQPEDFKVIVRSHISEDMAWYLNDVFNTTKWVDYSIESVNGSEVTVKNAGTLTPPLELAFYDDHKTETGRRWLEGFTGSRNIPLPENTATVVIDPDEFLPDLDYSDNFSRKHGIGATMIFDQPDFSTHFLGNIAPAASFNAFNRSLGLAFKRGYSPMGNPSLMTSPQWDFRNKQLVGRVKAEFGRYRFHGFDEVKTAISLNRDQGRISASLKAEAYLREPVVFDPFIKLYFKGYYHSFEDASLFDPVYWDVSDPVTSIQGGVQYFKKFSPLLKMDIRSSISYATGSDKTYSGAAASVQVNYRYNKKGWVKGKISWISTGNDELRQYLPRLGGWVDPDFQSYVWDRSGTGDFTPLSRQYVGYGPSMRVSPDDGSVYSQGLGVSMDFSTFNPMLWVFFDYLYPDEPYVDDSGKSFKSLASLGLSAKVGFVKIYIPLWTNWNPEILSNRSELENAIRVHINLDMLKMLRIGR